MIIALPTIKIEGVCGSGKTIIARAIAEALQKHGIICPIIYDNNSLPSSREKALKKIGLFKGKTIEIKTVQTKRNIWKI